MAYRALGQLRMQLRIECVHCPLGPSGRLAKGWAGSSHAQVTGLTPCTQPRLPYQPDSRCLLNPTVTAIAFSNSLFNPAQLPLPQLLLPQLRRTSRCTTWTPPTLGRRAGRTFCP